MTVKDAGVVEVVHRVRTFSRAKSKLVDVLREQGELERAAIIHIQDEAAALAFKEQAKGILPENTIVVSVKPTSGIHLGVNSIGFVSVRKSWQQ
jgi:fatty acid-binding protein DegV